MSKTALWKKLDGPGHDACRLTQEGPEWVISGTSVFRDEAGPACIGYALRCGRDWRTRSGWISGFLRAAPIKFEVRRTGGGWLLNGEHVRGVDDLTNLDFSFTPATNYPHICSLGLSIGEKRELPVAWLDLGGALTRLPQTYERRSETHYWYEAPSVGYTGVLVLAPNGFVHSYPGLWEMVD